MDAFSIELTRKHPSPPYKNKKIKNKKLRQKVARVKAFGS